MKTFLCIILLALITFSCQKEISQENIVSTLPTLTTAAVTSITATTATSGGDITDNGGAVVTARGVCWGTSPNPVITGNHTTDGRGSGAFASNITGLTISTIYYVRAYATNSAGTAYGNEISFTTTNTSTALPTVITASITAVTMTTATGGGNVVADGGAAVTARGVCWGTTANPTIALSTKTTDGTGTGIFASAITGLTAATIYHVRAYATNSVGTSYGGDSTFTTTSTSTIPTITTTAVTAITNTTASSGGTISTDGGAAITARGVCWSTTPNPTIALSTKTTDGTGIGTFTSAITGLTAATTYHVRAYATNSAGTAYGSNVTFTTTSSTPDVYVAGLEFGATQFAAKIWKNGVATSLTNGANDASANSIFASGTDVYATGWENSTSNQPKLWKNGIASTLTSTCGGDGLSVFVSGTDVYVAGTACNPPLPNSQATVWKNNVPTTLSNSTFNVEARSVYVSGTDVYVAGWEERSSSLVIAKMWKNGVETALTSGSVAFVYSIFVSGTDVYVAGAEDNGLVGYIAKIWKNGVAIPLTTGANEAEAYGVYVSGTDVYAAGTEYNGTKYVAKVWKNGVATALTNGSNDAEANSVFVYGTDVYVTGEEFNGTKYVAKIWKNGVATTLTNGANDAYANSIFVK
jgi:hypothetical protein